MNLISGCSASYGMPPATREDSSALCSAQSCLFFVEFESSNHSTLGHTYLRSSCSLPTEIIVTCIVCGQRNNIKEVTLVTTHPLHCVTSGLKTHRKRRESGVLVHLLIPTPVLVRIHYHLINLMVFVGGGCTSHFVNARCVRCLDDL